MKKMTCLLLSLLLCLSLFAGCSGKAGDKGELVLYAEYLGMSAGEPDLEALLEAWGKAGEGVLP